MENAGKMEEMEEQSKEKASEESFDLETSKPAINKVDYVNGLPSNPSYGKRGKGGRSVLIKQEERETGVVSWHVLMR